MLDPNDHRAIGARLDLFHLQEEAPGSVYWHPRGNALFRVLEDFLRRELQLHGYHEVRTPQVVDQSIWEQSGHWQNFRDGMLVLASEAEHAPCCALKPVNCPNHIQIFKQRVRSHRALPMRLAEFGVCHRNEPRGALLGLMRLRSFVQDDAHIFCARGQLEDEVARACALLAKVYAACGLADFQVKLSTRPALRAGSDDIWDQAEAALAQAAAAAGIVFELNPGEGAFYGPKLEFVLKDARGRHWQCGTVQLDMVLPERFDLAFVNNRGGRERPIMLHRAILGSLERFIGILLEHHGGHLPMWLAPEQVLVVPVGAQQRAYAREVQEVLLHGGLRACLSDGDAPLGKRVAEAHARAIPRVVVVGAREEAARNINLRLPDGAQQVLPLMGAVHALAA
jgi:threonyl-tRNA synthetase